MRPTIPLSHWKIAVNLQETRAIQRNPGMLATNCKCAHCENWRLVFNEVLPKKLISELERIGISPGYPSDSYGGRPKDGIADFRVWYHVVGKILSGPSVWMQKELGGESENVRNYTTLEEHPYFVSLAIQSQEQFYDPAPELDIDISGKLIQIDFRTEVPWRLSRMPL